MKIVFLAMTIKHLTTQSSTPVIVLIALNLVLLACIGVISYLGIKYLWNRFKLSEMINFSNNNVYLSRGKSFYQHVSSLLSMSVEWVASLRQRCCCQDQD